MKTEKQKTWIDILGASARNCIVDGRYISRRIGPNNYKVMMDCGSHEMALDVMGAWHEEIAKTEDDRSYFRSDSPWCYERE